MIYTVYAIGSTVYAQTSTLYARTSTVYVIGSTLCTLYKLLNLLDFSSKVYTVYSRSLKIFSINNNGL